MYYIEEISQYSRNTLLGEIMAVNYYIMGRRTFYGSSPIYEVKYEEQPSDFFRGVLKDYGIMIFKL